jgi:hypothetical protein
MGTSMLPHQVALAGLNENSLKGVEIGRILRILCQLFEFFENSYYICI